MSRCPSQRGRIPWHIYQQTVEVLLPVPYKGAARMGLITTRIAADILGITSTRGWLLIMAQTTFLAKIFLSAPFPAPGHSRLPAEAFGEGGFFRVNSRNSRLKSLGQ